MRLSNLIEFYFSTFSSFENGSPKKIVERILQLNTKDTENGAREKEKIIKSKWMHQH